ncbi:MAG: type 4a pilus biogenesis protein PilO [Planctomycetota bacterium]
MRIGPREIVFFVVLLALPMCSWYFVFHPQNVEISEARKEIEHKEQMLEKLDAATEQTDDLQRLNDEIAAGISLVEARLPDGKDVDVVLDQVSELARKSRLELTKVKTTKQLAAADYMEQQMEMSISGDFDDFYEFLLRVENLDRISRMLDMELKKASETDGVAEASFTISVYFQPSRMGGV